MSTIEGEIDARGFDNVIGEVIEAAELARNGRIAGNASAEELVEWGEMTVSLQNACRAAVDISKRMRAEVVK